MWKTAPNVTLRICIRDRLNKDCLCRGYGIRRMPRNCFRSGNGPDSTDANIKIRLPTLTTSGIFCHTLYFPLNRGE